jgi:hypothetical protein
MSYINLRYFSSDKMTERPEMTDKGVIDTHFKASIYYGKKKLRGLSPQANYTDRATAAVGEVVPAFAGRGCYVVSVTDSHGR